MSSIINNLKYNITAAAATLRRITRIYPSGDKWTYEFPKIHDRPWMLNCIIEIQSFYNIYHFEYFSHFFVYAIFSIISLEYNDFVSVDLNNISNFKSLLYDTYIYQPIIDFENRKKIKEIWQKLSKFILNSTNEMFLENSSHLLNETMEILRSISIVLLSVDNINDIYFNIPNEHLHTSIKYDPLSYKFNVQSMILDIISQNLFKDWSENDNNAPPVCLWIIKNLKECIKLLKDYDIAHCSDNEKISIVSYYDMDSYYKYLPLYYHEVNILYLSVIPYEMVQHTSFSESIVYKIKDIINNIIKIISDVEKLLSNDETNFIINDFRYVFELTIVMSSVAYAIRNF